MNLVSQKNSLYYWTEVPVVASFVAFLFQMFQRIGCVEKMLARLKCSFEGVYSTDLLVKTFLLMGYFGTLG
jgi:hypothetical protein